MTDLPAPAGSHQEHVDERVWRAAPWHTLPALELPSPGARVLAHFSRPYEAVLV